MRRLLSAPLTYLVLGEALVLVALGIAAWHLAGSLAPRTAAPASAPPGQDGSQDGLQSIEPEPLPTVPVARPKATPKPAAAGASAGAAAATDPAYWADRLAHLNSDQADLQRLQWNVIQAVKVAAERYLREVVLAAVERAERAHPAPTPTPATAQARSP